MDALTAAVSGRKAGRMSVDIERELDKFEAISKHWLEWCLDCKHSYKRKDDDDTMWCRLRKRKCPHLSEMEEE